MKLRVLLFAVLLAACGQNAAKGGHAGERPHSPEDLQIEIGRYSRMVPMSASM